MYSYYILKNVFYKVLLYSAAIFRLVNLFDIFVSHDF